MLSSISSIIQVCLKQLGHIIASHELEKYQSEVLPDLWSDELGRLRVWTANIGAHRTDQSSLDYRLRDASHLKDQTLRALGRLQRTIQDLQDVLHQTDLQGDFSSDLDDSEDEDQTDIQKIFHSLRDTINVLFNNAMSIRRPAHHDRLLGIKRSDIATFEPFDRQHVANKFPCLDIAIQQRLGLAISQRRAFLRYRERHHLQLAQGLNQLMRDMEDTKSTIFSETTATEFVLKTTEDNVDLQSKFSQTMKGKESMVVPPPPKESSYGNPFECPYCFFLLNIDNKHSWAQHVFHDLMPYICVFPDCQTPHRLFGDRHEWYTHLQIEHAVPDDVDIPISCPLCLSVSSGKLLEEHLGQHLQELALFALSKPVSDEDGKSYKSKLSEENRFPESSGSHDNWEIQNPVYDYTDTPVQNPASFVSPLPDPEKRPLVHDTDDAQSLVVEDQIYHSSDRHRSLSKSRRQDSPNTPQYYDPDKLGNPKSTDLNRKSSTRDHRDKERSQPSREEKMVGAYAGAAHHAPEDRSSSNSRRSPVSRQYDDSYYEYAGVYHAPAPMDHRQGEYPYHVQQRPPVPDFSSSPHTTRYPGTVESIQASHSGRSHRYHSYNTDHSYGRPVSLHGMPPGMGSGMTSGRASPMYSQSSMQGYEHGPPLSNSAYMQNQSSSSPYGQTSYYAPSEYPRERSQSREPPRRRSSSIYGPPQPSPMDSGAYSPLYEDEMPPLERCSSREIHGRPSTTHQEQDEGYYRMSPPPPPPPMAKPTPKSSPQVHQVKQRSERHEARKSHTSTAAIPQRHVSRGMDGERGVERDYDRMDMADLRESLPVIPDRRHLRMSMDALPPERTQSLRDHRYITSYRDERRSTQVAVASSRRRKPTEYYEAPTSTAGDLEDREGEMEDYQAALLPAKTTNRNDSESGSGTGSRTEADHNMTLTLNGLKIGFAQEAVAGRSINISSGENGAPRLNIGGNPRKPKQYVNDTSSDYTSGFSRQEPEDG
ncbi:unnamed protein product [Penicillium salamii]|nr:unnamed protein product [Penicillium salamii]